MLVPAPTDVLRAVIDVLRRTDAHLAREAARNAAESVTVPQSRALAEARALRDLHRGDALRAARSPAT